MKIAEYYQFYLSMHTNHLCRRMHFLGQWVTIFFTYFVIKNSIWLLIPLIPFVIYPFAWAGHLYFEKNKPLAWEGVKDGGRSTIKAKICDWIMFKDIMIGRLSI